MAMGIGQQIKGMVDRARHYWAELTDEKDSRQRTHDERQDSVHQRYGGVRGEDDADLDTGRRESPSDRIPPDASPGSRSARGDQNTQMGGQSDRDHQMQGASQTQRQYTQQGGSGIQKTLGEQLGGSDSEADRPRGQQGRRPGQQNH